MSIFEITGKDIAELKDDELRELIGLLCESELHSSGNGVAGIRYGGHQDAKDGGVDIMVDSNFAPPENSFVPRKVTAFQVKIPKMSKSKILLEMKPACNLRPEIMNLIRQKGAYIMVSSGDSVTESTYNKRVEAMKEAISGEEDSNELYIDFFDQKRVATWVRSHPAMILWVRKKVGREYPGWQPYGNWSNAPGGIQEEYLFDDQARLFDFTKSQCREMSILEGVAVLRQKLSKPGKSIRLTGLSGVGKTRFVQALFDDRLDGDKLNPFTVYYTDSSDNPAPDPRVLAGQLVESNQHNILIIDNCPPELHRKLTCICRGTQSNISLLTIEYDFRDEDFPEETEVYRLEPASLGIIIQVISNRYPHISQNDVINIAEFSGGNARIAIALASTIESGETLASLRDEYLFERLFWQKKNQDKTLLQAAEVLSLLYSFEGTETDSGSELFILSSLIEISPAALYKQVGELKARGLLQERSNWRAILPQAIANRLAKNALKTIPKKLIVSTILDSGNDRVVKSFFHRLSYLHDSPKAGEIISDWIFQNGWSGEKIFSLNDLEIQIMQYIAPVCPERILTILESAADHESEGKWFTSRDNPKFVQYVKILRYLAYDAEYFYRCANLLAKFASSEAERQNVNPIRDYFKALFFRSWSGTLASPEARFRYIEELLCNDDTHLQKMGVLALEGSLKVFRFFPPPENSFGAKPRGSGYIVKREEVLSWYDTSINICTAQILSGKPAAKRTKTVLAESIRELWVKIKAYDAIEISAIEIRKNQNWNEAWISTIDIIEFDKQNMTQSAIERLIGLRDILKPSDLESFVRAYVLTNNFIHWDLEPEINNDERRENNGHKRVKNRTMQLGIQLAKDSKALDKLMMELVSINNSQVYTLGQGLALGASHKLIIWAKMKIAFIKTPKDKRGVQLIQGFLYQCSKESIEIYAEILDEILEDEIFGSMYPMFESSASLPHNGLQRLFKSLELNKCAIEQYSYFAFSKVHECIEDGDLAELIEVFLEKENGYLPSSDLLWRRFSVKNDPTLYSEKLLSIARTTLEQVDYSSFCKNDHGDHILTSIAKTCLKEDCPDTKIKRICLKIQQAFSSNYFSFYRIESYVGFIVQTHPEIFLDIFLENPIERNAIYDSIFNTIFHGERNPLNKVSDKRLIAWCENDPDKRFIWLSKIIQPFTKCKNSSVIRWREIVFYIFEKVDALETILDSFADSVLYTGVTDSYLGLMEERKKLFDEINDHSNDKISIWAKTQISRINRDIKDHIDLEESSSHASYVTFE